MLHRLVWYNRTSGAIASHATAKISDIGDRMKISWAAIESRLEKDFSDVAGVNTNELAAWLADPNRPDPILVDARDASEFAVSHLQNAIQAQSWAEFKKATGEQGTTQPVVIYCSVGIRSAKLARILKQNGFSDVYNLRGSIFQWANEGKALYREQEQVLKVHPFDRHWGKLLEANHAKF